MLIRCPFASWVLAGGAGGRDEGTDPLVILDPGLELEASARVHRPRADGRDRGGDVLGAQPAREEKATLGAGGPLPVGWILLEPGKVEHARHLLPAAQEDAVPRPVAVLFRVQLDEGGAGVLGPAGAGADRGQRPRARGG